jgi:hypothetical protein
VECSRPRLNRNPSVNEHRGSPAPAQIRAVHWALFVQGKVPFAGGILPIAIEPAFGGVVGPAAVDVVESATVVILCES